MDRSREPTVVSPLSPGAIDPHRALVAIAMVAVLIFGVAGVIVALSVGHVAAMLGIVLIALSLVTAAAVC